uniref:Uncharacterized protein MANES_S079600 n=1 Tax=Rhizophora mucronata TaxID=61149 RepID=A0A2P2MMJ8_RHIMU
MKAGKNLFRFGQPHTSTTCRLLKKTLSWECVFHMCFKFCRFCIVNVLNRLAANPGVLEFVDAWG